MNLSTGHADINFFGEVSPGVLIDSTDTCAPMIKGDDSAKGNDTFEIVRATPRFTLAPELFVTVDQRKLHKNHTKKPLDDNERGACYICQFNKAMHAAQWQHAFILNKVIGIYWAVDSNALYRFYDTETRVPSGKEWPFPKIGKMVYNSMRKEFPNLLSGIIASAAWTASSAWKRQRYDTLVRLSKHPPYFNKTFPISLRSQDVDLVKIGSLWLLRFSLTPGVKRTKQFEIPIKACDDAQVECLNALCEYKWKMGEVRLFHDIRGKDRWYATISYKRLVRRVVPDERIGIIHRGSENYVVAVTWDGDCFIDEGSDIKEYLIKAKIQRKNYKRSLKSANKYGKGCQRPLKALRNLRGKVSRWQSTRLQQTARALADWFKNKGATSVHISKFSIKPTCSQFTTWPYVTLQSRIISCLEEYGISTVVSEK